MWRSLFALCLALVVQGERDARAQLAMTKSTAPYAGVTHQVWTDPSVPIVAHLVIVDISSQEIHLSSTQSSERGQTVSDWANCVHGAPGCSNVDVAINGDLFAPLGFVPAGLAMGGAQLWMDASMDNATEGFFAFGRPSNLNAVYLSVPQAVEMPPSTIAAEGVVGGRALLVQGGQAMSSYDPADPSEPFRAAPRTAVGLDDAKRTLYLAVVDGDQPSSLGMTDEELADFLLSRGAADALELDGAGSSTLYIRGEKGVVNSPSDGVQRPVANQLGITYGQSQYHFSVVGQIFDTNFGDTSKLITDADVVVDGQTATWNTGAPAHTVYNVNNISPHYVCAHGSAPKYQSATQCRQITEADVAPPNGTNIQYLSMVLYPCPNGATSCDPPPDMSAPPDFAMRGPPPDFALVRDLSASAASDGGANDNNTAGGCTFAASRAASNDEELVKAMICCLVVLCLGAAVKGSQRA